MSWTLVEKPLMRLMRFGGRQLFRRRAVQELNRGWLGGGAHPTLDRFFRESPIPVIEEPYRSMEIFWGYNFHRRPAPVRWPRIPALVLSGGRDPMFSLAMGEALAGRFDQGRHLHLPDCGHLLMAEDPEAVNGAIAAWIETEGLDQ